MKYSSSILYVKTGESKSEVIYPEKFTVFRYFNGDEKSRKWNWQIEALILAETG